MQVTGTRGRTFNGIIKMYKRKYKHSLHMAGNPENGERMAAFMHSQTKGHSHSHTKLVNLITRLYKQNRPQWYYPAVRCTKILSA
jgi:hypothetical protein